MTATAATPKLTHEALIVDSDQALLRRSLAFIEEGLDLGQPVLVVAPSGTLDLHRRHLGSRTTRHLHAFEDAQAWWNGPHRTMAAYHAAMAPLHASGRRWRLLAQPSWLSTTDGRYWRRFEAAANRTLAGHDYHSLCVHDRRALDDDAIHNARCTHPLVDTGHGTQPSPEWTDPITYLRAQEPTPLRPPPHTPRHELTDLATARANISAETRSLGATNPTITRIVLAANELLANAHAAAELVTYTTWRQEGRIIVSVDDNGAGFDVDLAGYTIPDPHGSGGRGLWIVRQLASDLSITRHTHGITAQAHFALEPTSHPDEVRP